MNGDTMIINTLPPPLLVGQADSLSAFLNHPMSAVGLIALFIVAILTGHLIPRGTLNKNQELNDKYSQKSDDIATQWKALSEERQEQAEAWKKSFYEEKKRGDELMRALKNLVAQGKTTEKLNTELIRQFPVADDSMKSSTAITSREEGDVRDVSRETSDNGG